MIVDVLGDTGALAFERLLPFDALQLEAHPAAGDEPGNAGDQRDG